MTKEIMTKNLVIQNGLIVTANEHLDVFTGDIWIKDDCIVSMGSTISPPNDATRIDATNCIVMPGLIQTHVHTCQTLARGYADHLSLLDWLKQLIWPYEATLTASDVAIAAKLAMTELVLGGTTSILDMGTVRHTEHIFQAAHDIGIRAHIGKVMMDKQEDMIPKPLQENTRQSIDESIALYKQWHGKGNKRLHYALAPRFSLSCTEQLLVETAQIARDYNLLIHTHANETLEEIELIQKELNVTHLEYLHSLGLTGKHVALAHCVHLQDIERNIIKETETHIVHCPSSNLKLASGIAPTPEYLKEHINIGIGADGAPCNNNLDGFWEMRLAALIQCPRFTAKALQTHQVLRMATLSGAQILGSTDQIGSLEVNKKADIIIVDNQNSHTVPQNNPYSTLVYTSRSSDVRDVIIDGKIIVKEKHLLTADTEETIHHAQEHANEIFKRI